MTNASGDFQDELEFEAADDAAEEGQSLILDIDGFEGPLHLLLELARMQKVDLARLSIYGIGRAIFELHKYGEGFTH